MVLNPYANIIGKVECGNDPPAQPEECPAQSDFMGGISPNNDTGEWLCPKCFAILHIDEEGEDEMFDDDDDEGDAFDNDEEYIAEAERVIVTMSDEERSRLRRYRALEELSATLSPINMKLAVFLERERYFIVDELRLRESSGEEGFRGNTNLKEKILAIAIHKSKTVMVDSELRRLGINPNLVRRSLRILEVLSPNEGVNSFDNKVKYVAKAVGISDTVASVMIEQFEEAGSPGNREGDETTRAAAWIKVMAKSSGVKVTKKALLSVRGVKRNALDRAIESYEFFLLNRNKAEESVDDS